MKKLIACLLTLLCVNANASLLYVHDAVTIEDANAVWAIGSAQRIGSRFTLNDSLTLTGAYSWLSSMTSRPGVALDLDMVIYASDDDQRLPTKKLFHERFNPGADATLGWYGLDNISWTLSAGTYFLALEATRDLSWPYGYVYQAPVKFDFDYPGIAWNRGWSTLDYASSWGQEMALRFTTTNSSDSSQAVPEPQSVALFLITLCSLFYFKLKSSRQNTFLSRLCGHLRLGYTKR